MRFYKPSFWDLKKNTLLSYILLPFTLFIKLNNLIISYQKKNKTNEILSICVGNIYVGGTGKTPTVIKLYELIKKINHKIIVAKKNNPLHRDEIYLLKKKTNFITGSSRKEILLNAIKKKNKIIIFDDGLQEKKIEYSLRFVCFDTMNWIGNGNLLPAGPLRQNLKVLKKVHAVFLKNINNQKNLVIKKIIKTINPQVKIFTSNYIIRNLDKINLKKKYIIFSGIGNPKSFEELLKKYKINFMKHIIFPDHYSYNYNDLKKIIIEARENNCSILTTEKDYIKIPTTYKKKIECIRLDFNIDKKTDLINYIKKNL